MSKKPFDPPGGHSRVYWDVQDSMAWRALDWSAICLWMAMRRKLLSFNNGNIEATIETLRHQGFKSPTTLAKGLRSLEAVGFIVKTRQGGVALGQRICSLFRFTDELTFAHPKLGIEAGPATNDWKKFETLAAATQAIDDAHAAVLGTGKNKLGEQKLYSSSTDSVAARPIFNTDSVVDASALEQKLFQSRALEKLAEPRPASLTPEMALGPVFPATATDSVHLCMLPPIAVAE